MVYHVYVSHHSDNGYVATVLGWPNCEGVGATREEAIAKARMAIQDLLERGEIIKVSVGDAPPANPWDRMVGQFEDDPQWDEYQQELSRLREEANRG